jgi:cellulose synthase/poly-beta-1,6-N-acetylglucosamine synthase-like glycosyltransferase
MTGFLHFFLSVINPADNFGFSRALPQMLESAYLPWWSVYVLPFTVWFLPPVVCWLIYLVRPAIVRRPLAATQAKPFVSVVIAGRNESASIGQAIRSALLCGYANLEVIFVDDHSDDNSVAIARRAARSVTGHRWDADRVRIFPSPRRNGKASSLNIGIRMARGEFIAILDADSAIQFGTMEHWLLPFADPRVGAVCANIRVLNSRASLLTRLQVIEYALKFTVNRWGAAHMGLLPIIPGMGGLFRGEILRRLGGYDTGLGDDTDMTMNLRNQRWKLAFHPDAVVWTIVPVTREHLWRQRMRWHRNVIKIRVSKHRDQFVLGRYGFANAVLALQLLFRIILPWMALIALLVVVFDFEPLTMPGLVVSIYWIYLIFLLVKCVVGRDIARTPQPEHFPLLLVFPFYMLTLHVPIMYAQMCELFRIGAKHPYVPDHIWQEIPWW